MESDEMSENVQAINVGDAVRVKVGRGVFDAEVARIEGDSAEVYIAKTDRMLTRKLSLISKAEQIAA